MQAPRATLALVFERPEGPGPQVDNGRLGTAGKMIGQFGTVNAIDYREESELLVGELGNWRVQRVTLLAFGGKGRHRVAWTSTWSNRTIRPTAT